jgi:prepilin-type N-terminal cleavage/methylation domain-containing protein
MLTLRHGPGTKAFTLLELIVVIVILGLLAALAIPTFARVTKKSQDASTAATAAAVLRDARAMMAFGDTDWEASVKTAAEETVAPSAAGFSAAALSVVPSAVEPLSTSQGAYQLLGSAGVMLSLKSASGSTCVGIATLTSATTPWCATPAEAAAVSNARTVAGAVLSGEVASVPLPSGVTAVPATPAPSAPTALTTSAVANTTATLAWTPGAANAATVTVTGYLVTATPATGTAVTATTGASAVSANLTGLTSGTTYDLSVVALTSGTAKSAALTGTLTTLSGTPIAGMTGVRFPAGTVATATSDIGATYAPAGAIDGVSDSGVWISAGTAGSMQALTITMPSAQSVSSLGVRFVSPRNVTVYGDNVKIGTFVQGTAAVVSVPVTPGKYTTLRLEMTSASGTGAPGNVYEVSLNG